MISRELKFEKFVYPVGLKCKDNLPDIFRRVYPEWAIKKDKTDPINKIKKCL